MADFELEPWYRNRTASEARDAEVLKKILNIGSYTLEKIIEIED